MFKVDAKVKAAIGMVVLGATASAKVLDRYFSDQKTMAAVIAAVDKRLAVIEAQVRDIRRNQ